MTFLLCDFAAVPSHPYGVTLLNCDGHSMILGWKVPKFSGGAPILGYYVDKREAHHKNWHAVNSSPVTERILTVGSYGPTAFRWVVSCSGQSPSIVTQSSRALHNVTQTHKQVQKTSQPRGRSSRTGPRKHFLLRRRRGGEARKQVVWGSCPCWEQPQAPSPSLRGCTGLVRLCLAGVLSEHPCPGLFLTALLREACVHSL